mgnify:CR=1 FL=1
MISTGYGDKGFTDIKDQRIRKDSLQINCIGSVDEAMAALSLLLSVVDNKENLLINEVLFNLYEISAIISGYPNKNLKRKFRNLTEMQKVIDSLAGMSKFTIGYAKPIAAQFNFARAMVRKAERDVVTLVNEVTYINEEDKEDILIYLNRLSDFLFACAEINK